MYGELLPGKPPAALRLPRLDKRKTKGLIASMQSALSWSSTCSRFALLPPHLTVVILHAHIRPFSSSSALAWTSRSNNAANSSDGSPVTPVYPFPRHANATPYEIFHLSPGATQSEVKSRYYELVRVHHPDSPHTRELPAHICHARFQAITSAYDILTGKARKHSRYSPPHNPRHGHRYQHHNRSHNTHAEWARHASNTEEDIDNIWKDRVLMVVGIGVIAAVILPSLSFAVSTGMTDSKHVNAAQNLAQARRDAREFGQLRRAEIHKRVRVNQLEQEYEDMVTRNERSVD